MKMRSGPRQAKRIPKTEPGKKVLFLG